MHISTEPGKKKTAMPSKIETDNEPNISQVRNWRIDLSRTFCFSSCRNGGFGSLLGSLSSCPSVIVNSCIIKVASPSGMDKLHIQNKCYKLDGNQIEYHALDIPLMCVQGGGCASLLGFRKIGHIEGCKSQLSGHCIHAVMYS